MFILGPTATRTVVAYNYIGLNAAGTAAIRNGLGTTGHSILVLNSNGNTIGDPASVPQQKPSFSLQDIDVSNPDANGMKCVQSREDGSFVRFDTLTRDWAARNCTTGETFIPGPLGNIFDLPFGGQLFSVPNIPVSAKFFPADKGLADIGIRNAIGNISILDADLSNNGSCQCPPTGREFLLGALEFGGFSGSNFNMVVDNVSGVDAAVTTNLSLPGERSIWVSTGLGNVFSRNYSVTVDQSNIIAPSGSNNIVSGGFYISGPNVASFSGFDLNFPNYTVSTRENGVVSVVGTVAGPPNASMEVEFFDEEDVHESERDSKSHGKTGISRSMTTGPDGTAFFQIDFTGYEAERARTAAALAATATLFDGPVMRPDSPYSQTVAVPVRTSQMSPAIPVTSVVTVSGRVTTPGGIGLRNATVSITNSSGVRQTATTSSFGFYTFGNVGSGQAYTITVLSRLYRFAPRMVLVNGNLTDVDFVGLE